MLSVMVLMALCVGPYVSFESLVDGLADDNFDKRYEAYLMLDRGGSAAVYALRRGAASTDLETKDKCQKLLAKLDAAAYTSAVEIVDKHFEDFPFLDALWYDVNSHTYVQDSIVSRRLYRYIQYADGNPADVRPYSQYRAATRHWTIDLVKAGMPVYVIKGLHMLMWYRDIDFLNHRDFQWVQPDWWPWPRPAAKSSKGA